MTIPSEVSDTKGVSRPVGRVLCPALAGRRSSIWDCRCRQPRAVYPRASGGPPSIARAGSRGSPLDLAPGGVYRAAAVTCGAGGLLHHRFTLTPALTRGRSVFCGTVPRVTPGRRYRPPCPVEPGPSSPGLRPARPPGRLTRAQDTPNDHRAGVADRGGARERRERFDRRGLQQALILRDSRPRQGLRLPASARTPVLPSPGAAGSRYRRRSARARRSGLRTGGSGRISRPASG